jgi:16S rRNA (cytidine1402-2'-O)-methyltransferase
LVFYESPRRLDNTLAAMAEIFGGRQAAVALELTKRFELVHRGTLAELAAEFADSETRGEAVIVVAGAAEASVPDAADWQAELLAAMADQPLRAAVDAITGKFGLKRKEVYDAALTLKAEQD